MKKMIVLGLVVAIGTIASLLIAKRQAAHTAARQTANAHLEANRELGGNQGRPIAEPVLPPAVPEPWPSPETINSPGSVSPAPLLKTEVQTKVKLPKQSTKTVPPPPSNAGSQTPSAKEEIKDPMARFALSFVGADTEANEYWIEAINDPSLSAHERQDLIEDLNEDGLSDPKHPTLEDLPVIASRILLIEALAPDAMDQVNAEAFQEAYKDLLDLYAGLTER